MRLAAPATDMKRSTLILLLVVSAAAALAYLVARRGDDALEVQIGAVEQRDVFRSWVTASGEIVATRYAEIGSSVMGRVVRLAVSEGQRVEEGEVLAVIDPVQARAELDAALERVQALQSEVAAAEARARRTALALERANRLEEDGLLAAADQDGIEAEAEAAAAQLAAARRRVDEAQAQAARDRDLLSKTEVRAPIGGIVTQLQVREGEMVVIGIQNQPGTILMTVSDLAQIDAEVRVAEADVLRLELEQRARVTLEALPDRPFEGHVVEIGASALPAEGAEAAAREFRVVVRLEAPDPALRPGLTCDVEILTAEERDALTVPLQAVVLREDEAGEERTGVYRVEDGVARFTPVEAGVIGGLDIEVTGVEAGVPVVTGPYQSLRDLSDGSPVRAAPEE